MDNQDFKWDDSLVKEIVTNALDLMHETTKHDCSQDYIEKFKASKQILLEYKILSVYIDQTPMFPIKPIYPIFGMIRLLIDGKIEYAQTIDDCLNKNECVKIFSVKRISDNCIFSIGDRITYKDEVTKINETIKSFQIRNNGHDVWLIYNLQHGFGGNINYYKKAEPKKQLILTTEDGVDIFDGEAIWHVSTIMEWKASKTKATKELLPTPIPPYFKYFSTKELAEEYINTNKPCLSVKSIVDYFKDKGLDIHSENLNYLIELAESKNK